MLRYPKREKTVTESPFNRQIIIIINLLSLCLKQKPLHLGNLRPNHTLQTLKRQESEKLSNLELDYLQKLRESMQGTVHASSEPKRNYTSPLSGNSYRKSIKSKRKKI